MRTGNGRCPPTHGQFCRPFDAMLNSGQQTLSQRIKKVGKHVSTLHDIVSRGYADFYPTDDLYLLPRSVDCYYHADKLCHFR